MQWYFRFAIANPNLQAGLEYKDCLPLHNPSFGATEHPPTPYLKFLPKSIKFQPNTMYQHILHSFGVVPHVHNASE